jgi:hypothetical protein
VVEPAAGFFGQYPSASRGPYLHGGFSFGAFLLEELVDFFFLGAATGAPPGIACRFGFLRSPAAVPRLRFFFAGIRTLS